MPLQLIGANELLLGNSGGDVDDLLGAYELVGWNAPRPPMGYGGGYGRPMAPPGYGRPPAAYGRPQQSPYQQAVNARIAQSSTVAIERGPTKSRRHFIPMNSNGTVAAAAAAAIQTQPQALAFRPERIVVPASIAPDFTIDSVFCGIKPQFVATGAIAAETFTQDARGVDMHMDTVATSQNFTLNVTNQSGAARQFRATVFGITADD